MDLYYKLEFYHFGLLGVGSSFYVTMVLAMLLVVLDSCLFIVCVCVPVVLFWSLYFLMRLYISELPSCELEKKDD